MVHTGGNQWIIVDSCVDRQSCNSVALSYLRGIGVNPDSCVVLVVASHWHDDHVRGLSQVVSECSKATFVCSEALRGEDFVALVKAGGPSSMMASSGVTEFNRILAVLEDRSSSRVVSPTWAIADRRIYYRKNSETTPECTVYSLSPSDSAISQSKMEIARLLPSEKGPKRRTPALTPNHSAVVLWVQIGKLFVVLGADLEETTDSCTGWSVIVDSNTRPRDKASVFKIPHHGSSSGNQPRIWEEMLIKSPTAILTPFVQGHQRLPTRSDARRICDRTSLAYITSDTRRSRSKFSDSAVNRTIQEAGVVIRKAQPDLGQVRLRADASSSSPAPWTCELFGAARPLVRLLA